MAEDLREFKNPEHQWKHMGGFTLKLTKSALHNHKNLPDAFKHEVVTAAKGRILKNPNETAWFFADDGSKYCFGSRDIIEIRKKDGSLLWVNFDCVCDVCGIIPANMHHDHVIRVVSGRGDPIAIVVDMQAVYNESDRKAQLLAFAHAELKQYFPGKSFAPMIPSRMMLTKHGENGVLLGEAYVASYITAEV